MATGHPSFPPLRGMIGGGFHSNLCPLLSPSSQVREVATATPPPLEVLEGVKKGAGIPPARTPGIPPALGGHVGLGLEQGVLGPGAAAPPADAGLSRQEELAAQRGQPHVPHRPGRLLQRAGGPCPGVHRLQHQVLARRPSPARCPGAGSLPVPALCWGLSKGESKTHGTAPVCFLGRGVCASQGRG